MVFVWRFSKYSLILPHFHSTKPREIVNISSYRIDVHMQFVLKVRQDDFRKSHEISGNLDKYFKLHEEIYAQCDGFHHPWY